ncbi:MAG: D-alanyl-D-alanine carboxypeptidase family protein [Myxococcales bacterium]|nr:D-alanyl-D-alanine carboxypeptidase family protein [Myxococcales bacterium]
MSTLRGGQSEVLDAIERIAAFMKRHAPDRMLPTQLLAVRKYLRSKRRGANLEAVWSWTDEEIEIQKNLEPTKSLYEEAAKVQANFRKANPDYHLILSPVRSLERQIRLWGKNTTVGKAGAKLLVDMKSALSEDDYPAKPDDGESVWIFSEALRTQAVAPEPTSAAPGTSDHGRGKAVDFVVMKGAAIVAPIRSSAVHSIWKKDGWEDKLIAACAGTKLVGPLKHPYESSHWWLK